VQAHAGEGARDTVEDAREDPSCERVATLRLPPGHEVEAFVELREQPRDLRWIVLEVAVDRDDGVAARLVEAGDERGGLAEVAAEPHDADVLLRVVQARQRSERPVGGAVVDEDRLPLGMQRLERRAQLVVEECDAAFLVVNGNDHGDHGHEPSVVSVLGVTGELLTREEALARVLDACAALDAEPVALAELAGRFAAEAVRAAVDLPPFPSSAMDGFALRAGDTPGRLPVVARVAAGAPAGRALQPGEAMGIATGGVVPDGADAVIPLEYVVDHDNEIEVRDSVAVGDNVRPRGGDVREGAVVVERGVRFGPGQIGAAAAAGVARVSCARRPRVAVLTTGTELREPGTSLGPGEIYEANGVLLAAALAPDADVERLPAVADDESAHRAALERGLQADVLVTSGGVSVGPHDLVRRILGELGVEEVFWGVAVKPGKPLAFGLRGSTLVFGLPGNPVSSFVSAELFVRPALLALQGALEPGPAFGVGRLANAVRRNERRDEFLRARRRLEDDGVTLEPVAGQESHMIAAAANADALVHAPRGEGELAAGDLVRYLPLA
jgi:molybdopterin molybdotransferase